MISVSHVLWYEQYNLPWIIKGYYLIFELIINFLCLLIFLYFVFFIPYDILWFNLIRDYCIYIYIHFPKDYSILLQRFNCLSNVFFFYLLVNKHLPRHIFTYIFIYINLHTYLYIYKFIYMSNYEQYNSYFTEHVDMSLS